VGRWVKRWLGAGMVGVRRSSVEQHTREA
jgi:hypothetical protein